MNREELIKMRDTLNDWIESFEVDEQELPEDIDTPKGLKYKVGDYVILRDDLEDYKTYAGLSYSPSMSYLRNGYTQIDCIDYDVGAYRVDGWCITDEIIDHDKSLFFNSFTKDERQFLSFLDSKYEWIAKDEDGDIWIYKYEPTKNEGLGVWNTSSPESDIIPENFFSLKFDKLGTDQPVRIYRDLNY